MSIFLFELLLFTSKVVVIALLIIIVFITLATISARIKAKLQSHIQITHLNEDHNDTKHDLLANILDKKNYKKMVKDEKKKQKAWLDEANQRKRVFHIQFDGDIQASANTSLTKLINAILSIARPEDEVIVGIESGGGMVHAYGLASAQLMRLRQHNIRLTVCIDKVAASGGYMMACIADRILAAPFAIIGSIGVVMQLPNFNRFLKEHHIDFELQTAGEYKRTLTMFGENTDAAREKVKEELNTMHHLFTDLIQEHRPQINLSEIATGEHWLAKQALHLQLVDEIQTLDEYLLKCMQHADVYQLSLNTRKTFFQKMTSQAQLCWNSVLNFVNRSGH